MDVTPVTVMSIHPERNTVNTQERKMYDNPLIKHLFYREHVQRCTWTVLYMTFTSKEEMIASAKT